jgi:hypothetical protein
MKYLPLIAVIGSVLAGGCAVRTTERVVEKPVPVPAQTVVYADPAVAPTTTTTVYTTR